MKALEVVNLTKRYPRFTLDGVSFSVEEGRVVGLIGRNGAGKSTTLKGIFNLISTEGEVKLFGKPFRADEEESKSLIGYVGGGFRFYPLKTLRSVARTVSRFYPAWQEERYQSLLTEFSLDESKRINELSEGMKVKFSIALALSHGARVLVMDEPTSGLDPLSREELCDTVLSLVKKEGVSVLFSTHITSDLERIADDIVYISKGKLLAERSLSALLKGYRSISFATREEAEGVSVIGLKEVKNGYEGLILAGELPNQGVCREATLESIFIHLEREAENA